MQNKCVHGKFRFLKKKKNFIFEDHGNFQNSKVDTDTFKTRILISIPFYFIYLLYVFIISKNKFAYYITFQMS